MQQIPENFKNIQAITNIEDCINIARTINHFEISKEERYQIHLAKEYFVQNFSELDFSQINTVLSNPYFRKNIQGELALNIVSKYIDNQTPMPWFLNTVFELNDKPKTQYVQILLNHGKEEDVSKILLQDEGYLASLINADKGVKVPNKIINEYLKKDVTKLWGIAAWDEEEKIAWLNDNKEYVEVVAKSQFYYWKKLAPSLQNKLYDLILDVWNNDIKQVPCKNIHLSLDKNLFMDVLLSNLPFEFMKKVNEQHENYLKVLFSQEETAQDRIPMNKTQRHVKTNKFQQWLLHYTNGDNKLKFLFDKLPELAFQPIIHSIDFYEMKKDIFEHALDNRSKNFFNNMSNFIPHLSEKQKEILTAFTLYAAREMAFNDKDEYIWIENVVSQIPSEMFDKYWESNKNLPFSLTKEELDSNQTAKNITTIKRLLLARELNKKEIVDNGKKKMKV